MAAYISLKMLQKYDGFYVYYDRKKGRDVLVLTSNKWYKLSKKICVPRLPKIEVFDKVLVMSSSFESMANQCLEYFQEVYEDDWNEVVLKQEKNVIKMDVVKTKNEYGTILHFPKKDK